MEQKKFTIYDTPGSNSYEKAYEHAQIIRASLTRIPINMILLHEQLNKRYDQTIANIFNQLKIFKGYEHLVVLMVSHLDILDRDP